MSYIEELTAYGKKKRHMRITKKKGNPHNPRSNLDVFRVEGRV